MATASSEPVSVSMRKVRGMGEWASVESGAGTVYIVRTWGAAVLRPYRLRMSGLTGWSDAGRARVVHEAGRSKPRPYNRVTQLRKSERRRQCL